MKAAMLHDSVICGQSGLIHRKFEQRATGRGALEMRLATHHQTEPAGLPESARGGVAAVQDQRTTSSWRNPHFQSCVVFSQWVVPWLNFLCPACGRVGAVDLPSVSCRRCSLNAPFARLEMLTEERP
jgi:hypothetical protein